MKLIDYFLYITYRFAHYTLKKNEGDAKWSAFLHTSLYFGFFIIIILCLSGLAFENTVTILLKQNPLIGNMVILVFSSIILSLRYYHFLGISFIEESYSLMNKTKKRIVNWIIYAIMIGLPIALFIFFRLYIIGHLRW